MENVIAAAQAIYTDEQRMLLEHFRKENLRILVNTRMGPDM